jgi:HEPN domain-containing protein
MKPAIDFDLQQIVSIAEDTKQDVAVTLNFMLSCDMKIDEKMFNAFESYLSEMPDDFWSTSDINNLLSKISKGLSSYAISSERSQKKTIEFLKRFYNLSSGVFNNLEDLWLNTLVKEDDKKMYKVLEEIVRTCHAIKKISQKFSKELEEKPSKHILKKQEQNLTTIALLSSRIFSIVKSLKDGDFDKAYENAKFLELERLYNTGFV